MGKPATHPISGYAGESPVFPQPAQLASGAALAFAAGILLLLYSYR